MNNPTTIMWIFFEYSNIKSVDFIMNNNLDTIMNNPIDMMLILS